MTRRSSSTAVLAGVIACASLVLTGCAGDDGGAGGGGTEDAAGDVSAGGVAACSTALTATLPDGTTVELTESGAATFGDGVTYATFAADFAPDPDTNLLLQYPPVPDDGTIAYVSTAVYNQETDYPPLVAGDQIAWTRDFDVVTFAVILQSGTDQFGTNTDGAGTLTVTEVSEDHLCLDVDYTDAEKAVSGTISADVVS